MRLRFFYFLFIMYFPLAKAGKMGIMLDYEKYCSCKSGRTVRKMGQLRKRIFRFFSEKRSKNLSATRIIALTFVCIILVGALLLTLPIASRSGESHGFLTALFTATSATCVTGLVVVDTALTWSGFGQAVILFMIQIGGLGFMTIATMFSMLLKRKMGLREKEIMVESINTEHIGAIRNITGKIIAGTAIFEGLFYGGIFYENTALEGWRAGKIRFFVPMAAGSGAELVTGAAGRHPGEGGRRRGGLVRFNSKSY